MNKMQSTMVTGATLLAGMSAVGAAESTPLYKIGEVEVRPHLTYSMVYDDNIFLEHKSHVANIGNPGRDHDWISTITPGLRLNAGDVQQRQSAFFDANYEAAILRFANNTGSDAVDHNAKLDFGGKLNRLGVKVSQGLSSYSDADVHLLTANGRTKRKIWDTAAEANYEVSEKTSATLDFVQTISDYASPAFVDTVERSGHLWMDYQVLPKVKMGAGVGGGYLQVDNTPTVNNPNSAYYNGQVRLAWQATEKVTVNGRGGVESRHYQGQGVDRLGVIFGVGATWKATDTTGVTLQLDRGSKPSNANGNTVNEETTIQLSVKQTLADNMSLTLDGGYTMSVYRSSTANAATLLASAIHDDDYYFIKPGLSYRFNERAQASVYYQYRRNNSDLTGNQNDFYGNQLGVELTYRF
ncbi:MAG: hypothetical protein EBY09_17700 [Verrucomicrobia bacterium]|nr:hypothetical protein [Verrucomicrobiota bacterium]NBU07612.1 hypothetical protein [Pseudomonadota bacterium]NDA68441.1 hypothetical protein [Verrucomicrobiota bacterium]NDD38376.1 hypothetical protein [Verrucomicrobiota bacterium]NDF00313.1 hypothetical protein [Verrucomicrobiota bacterium]